MTTEYPHTYPIYPWVDRSNNRVPSQVPNLSLGGESNNRVPSHVPILSLGGESNNRVPSHVSILPLGGESNNRVPSHVPILPPVERVIRVTCLSQQCILGRYWNPHSDDSVIQTQVRCNNPHDTRHHLFTKRTPRIKPPEAEPPPPPDARYYQIFCFDEMSTEERKKNCNFKLAAIYLKSYSSVICKNCTYKHTHCCLP